MKPCKPIHLLASYLALALASPSALAQANTSHASSTRVLISGGTGQAEVIVHPDHITSLVLPEPVKSAVCSSSAFKCVTPKELENVVAIRPRRADPKLTGTATISTETLRITVVLSSTTNPKEATTQLTFEKQEVAEEIQARIDAAVAEALRKERAALETRVEERLALKLYRRLDERRTRAIDRNAERIVVRVPRVVRAGDDLALVWFEVENLSGSPYRVARVEVVAAGHDLAGTVVWNGRLAPPPTVGTVSKDGKGRGLVVIRGLAKLRGPVTLVVSEAAGKRDVTVKGIQLP